MDVERTIEFILKSQANAERHMESAERRQERAEHRMDKFDKRLDGISKLIQQGMRMLAQTAQTQKRTDRRFAELAQVQKRTDVALAELAQAQKGTQQSLKAFINSLRHGPNGRNASWRSTKNLKLIHCSGGHRSCEQIGIRR